jgi:Ca2+-binding EF-hand superfamily protein
MDENNNGYLNFRQFVCALSTVFRGDKDDILDFWFKMYDSDRDGYLSKKVSMYACRAFIAASP